jgi:hypothetical protein
VEGDGDAEMGYVVYDRSLYRTGFRPYLQTNTKAAASGMGGTPFDPEFLHGVVHQHGYPFSARGGWRLGGMGDAGVPDQSVAVYQGVWPSSSSFPSTVLQEVSDWLQQNGISVLSSNAGSSITSNVMAKPYSVSLQVQVRNGMGFGATADLASVIDHAFYLAAGEMPLSSAISSVGTGASGPGGGPGAIPPGQPEDWGQWLQDNAWLIGAGILAAVVLPRVL